VLSYLEVSVGEWKGAKMTPEQRDKQLINRVYGNVAIENRKVTKEMAAEQLQAYRKATADEKN
jgi:hypothetical protein